MSLCDDQVWCLMFSGISIMRILNHWSISQCKILTYLLHCFLCTNLYILPKSFLVQPKHKYCIFAWWGRFFILPHSSSFFFIPHSSKKEDEITFQFEMIKFFIQIQNLFYWFLIYHFTIYSSFFIIKGFQRNQKCLYLVVLYVSLMNLLQIQVVYA